MMIFSEISQKMFKKLRISSQNDFYTLILVIGIVEIINQLLGVYVNLEIHSLISFKGFLSSLDFATLSFGFFIGTLLYPKIHERFSLKTIFTLCSIALFINFGLLSFLVNTFFDFPLRCCTGIFIAIMMVGLACLESFLFKAPYRATLFGFITLELYVSDSLGASLVDFFHTPFRVFGISMIGILACLGIVWVWKGQNTSKKITSHKNSRNLFSSFYQIFIFAPLIFLGFFMVSCLGSSLENYLAIFDEGIGLSQQEAALMFSFAQLGALIFIPLGCLLGDKWGYENALLSVSVICFLSTLSAFYVTDLDLLSILFFIMRGSKVAFVTLIYSWVARSCTKENIAYGMSLISIVSSISSFITPISLGFLMNTFGNKSFLYWNALGVLLTLIVMIFQAKRAQREGVQNS